MSPPQPHPIEPQIWRACAGAAVQFPTVNSRVYYFPEGHIDEASSPPQNLSPILMSKPCIPCTISAVQFLADPITDEVFVKLVLLPFVDFNPVGNPIPPQAPVANDGKDEDDAITSFVKVLTPSDANNGGGFSVPRLCAESIFPPLNFNETPPFQTLKVTDVQGKTWEFRHIYRGTPKRHLLTTGWNHFVNCKKLISGDSVVFMKSREKLLIGIRRVNRLSSSGNNGDRFRYHCPIGGVRNIAEEEKQQEENCEEGFSRNGKGKLSPESVARAAEAAAVNMPFEVVYYPKKAGWSDFVVNAEVVNKALGIAWTTGMRVKMAVETDDSSRMTWYQGVISSIFSVPKNDPWRGSPWRMLEITWDEPEVLKNSKWVSPWQVELVHSLLAELPSPKKLRADDVFWMSTNEGGYPFSMTGFTNSTMEYLNQTLLRNGTSPPGMQGARHNQSSSESSFSTFLADNNHFCIGESSRNNTVPNVGISQPDDLSPDSNSLPPLNSTMGYLNQTLLRNGTSSADMQGARHNQSSSESSYSKFLADSYRFCIRESSGNDTVSNVGISQPDDLSLDNNSFPPLNSTMGYLNQTLLTNGTSPAGMQGARHNQSSESSFSNFLADSYRFCIRESFGSNTVPNAGISQPDDLSSDSNSLPPLDTGFVPKQSCNSIKPGPVSFQLFGVVIQTEQPVESGLHGTGCIVDDSTKGCNETEDIDNLIPLASLTYGNLV